MRQLIDSGIEWVGLVPHNWSFIKGKFIFAERNERGNLNNVQLLSPTQKYGVIPQSLYEELSGMKAVKLDEKTDFNTMKSIYAGDFCISLRSFQGGFEYSEYDGVVSPAYHVFHKTDDLCDTYYRYLFKTQSFISKMASLTKTFRDGKSIAFADFADSLLPVPPVSEQLAISSYLDHKCFLIDNIIARTRESIEEYKKLKQAIITQAVTKGVRGDRPMKDSGIEWIGDIPNEWIVSKVHKYCHLKTGSTPSTSNLEWFDGDILWFTPGDFTETYHLNNSLRTLSLQAIEDGVCSLVEKETVLMVGIGATAGKVGITERECYFNQQITAILPTKEIKPEYLLYWFIANAKIIRETAHYTTLPIINNHAINRYDLLFPNSIEEQLEIISYINDKCLSINAIVEKKLKLINELELLKKAIIYEYVTGKKEVPLL